MPSTPQTGESNLNNLETNYNRQLENLADASTRDEYNIFLVALNNLASQLRNFQDSARDEAAAWFQLGELLAEDGNQEGDPQIAAEIFRQSDQAFENRNLWNDLVSRAQSILAQTVPAPPDVEPDPPGGVPPTEPEDPEIPTPTPPTPPEPVPTPPTPPTPPTLPTQPDPPDFSVQDLLTWEFWEGLFGDVATISFDLLNFLPSKIDTAWSNIVGWSSSIFDSITNLPALIWSDTLGVLSSGFSWVTEESERLFRAVAGGIEDTIAGVLRPLTTFFSQDAFKELLDFLADPLSTIFSSGVNLALEMLESAGAILFAPLLDILRPIWDGEEAAVLSIVDFGDPQDVWQAALMGGAVGVLIGSFITKPLEARFAPIQWRANAKFQPRLLGQDDLIELLYKFPGLNEDITEEALKLGISTQRFARMISSRTELPFLPSLQDWFYRTRPDTAEVKTLLRRYKFVDQDIERILETWRELPGIQDVVRFSVREVYDADIVRDFNLDDNFGNFGVEDARRVGLDIEDARKYWRAHWELPSIDQVFRMFHRTTTSPISGFSQEIEGAGSGIFRVISLDRVNELLRVGDVMERWRDPLTRIAFTPFTRVDIRRLFRTGTFKTREQVVRAYIDIGYSDENAQLQADFVENLEAERTFDELETILAGQATDGTIEVGDALEELFTIDVPDRVKEFSQQRIEARVRRARIGEITGAFRQAFRFERIDERDLRDELEDLDIPKLTVDHIVTVERTRRGLDFSVFEQPELRAFGRTTPIRRFREGFTNSAELQIELRSLGYAENQVDILEIFADLERDTNIRSDTLTAYRAGLRTGRLTNDAFRLRAKNLGVDEDLVEVYILTDQLRRRLEDPTEEEKELRASGRGVVTRRFREGWTRTEGFQSEMASLGYTEREIDLYEIQADLEFDFDWKSDILRQIGEAFVRGEVTADVYLSRLGDLGMDADRATTHLARLTATLRPRLRIEGPVPSLPRYLTPTGRVEVRLAIDEFRDQQITRATLANRLAALEMPTELVEATVDIEVFRLETRTRPPEPVVPLFFETDEGKIRTRTLTTAFRNRLINGDQLLQGLLELEMPDDQADALTEFEVTRLARGLVGVDEEPVPFFRSEEGSIRARTLREAFRNDAIDSAQYRQGLLDLEVPANIADALVEFEETRKLRVSEESAEESEP